MYDIYVCQAWIFDIQEEDLNNQTNHSYTLDFLESPECNYDLSDCLNPPPECQKSMLGIHICHT